MANNWWPTLPLFSNPIIYYIILVKMFDTFASRWPVYDNYSSILKQPLEGITQISVDSVDISIRPGDYYKS